MRGRKGDPRGDRGQRRRGPAFFQSLAFPPDRRPIAQPIISEILSRLDFLGKVGLGYLTLDRPAETLSGGELQRVRLASGLGSGLVGVCYVLDEPSIGLHPRDNRRLIEALEDLRARGNTVAGRRAQRGDHAACRLAGRSRPRRGAPRRADRRRRARPPRSRPTRPRSPAATWPARSRSPCPPPAAAWR